MFRWLVGAAVAAALAVLIAAFYPSVTTNFGGPAQVVGMSVPGIALPRPEGGFLNLQALRGHYLLINLWATWCGPCRRETPALERLYR